MAKERINFEVDSDFKKKVVLKCVSNDISIKDYVTSLIEKDLKSKKNQNKKEVKGKMKNKYVYTISKNDVKKIAYKEDVDIIYTETFVIVCKKGSIKDFGTKLAYIYDNKKGKSE